MWRRVTVWSSWSERRCVNEGLESLTLVNAPSLQPLKSTKNKPDPALSTQGLCIILVDWYRCC